MSEIYGYSPETWNAAKVEIKGLLSERAKVRGMMPYSELVGKLNAIHFEPNSFTFAAMLGEVSTEEDTAGRGLLTVIVVHRDGDMQPGPGFFELAKRRGRKTRNILECWIEELHRVHAVWSGARSNASADRVD